LLEAVWRWVKPQLASGQGHARLRRLLARRVRKLIRRFRTRKVARRGGTLTVLLAVTVDEAAVRDRLRALKVRLKQPGVLLVAQCDAQPLAAALTRSLAGESIRVVPGPWPADQRAAMVQAAAGRPGVVRPWARQAHAAVVVVARCETRARGRIVAAGVTGVRTRLVVEAYAPRGRSGVHRILWLEQAAYAHDADVQKAGGLAAARALAKLARRLGPALAPVLPAGLTRTLLVRLRGSLRLSTLLKITRQLSVQLQGVHAVTPRRFARGVTWLAVQTLYDPARLEQILTTFRPPPGWQLKTSKGPHPGTVDLQVEPTEDPE
jgi:hypothetical protein